MYEHDALFAELSAQGLINALQTRKAETVVASRTIYGDLLSEPNSKVDFSEVTAVYCDESVPQTPTGSK